ncbi:oxidoreductase [Comamonas sp. Z3]|nr:oxidoreductase [Comamonas sp. Z3]
MTHVKKTNGYEEDGHYRVEFTYDIELKDPDTLKRMRQTYMEERDRMKAWEDAGKADQQQIATLKTEILALRKEHNSSAPRREDFNFNNPPGMGFLEEDAYRKALVQWENEHPLPSSLRQKMQALDAIEQEARQRQERNQPKNTIYNQVTEKVWSMYVAGCPNGGSAKLFDPALQQVRMEAIKSQDVLYWLQEQQLQMKGKITMRKTENGCRALSEG